MPMKKPSTVPRPIGQIESRHSSAEGRRSFSFGLFDFRGSGLTRGQQNFRETEQSHGHRNDADTVTQFDQAIAKAKEASHRIDADHAQEKPQCRHRQRLEHGAAAHIGEHQETEHEQGEILGRSEAKREAG